MSETIWNGLLVATIVGTGVVTGVFFAFSTFVMPALARLPASQGAAAMQSINVLAVTPLFMTALFGTALLCAVVAGETMLHWNGPGAAWVVAGAMNYLLGIILVTIVGNVPLNNALAGVDAMSDAGIELWKRYQPSWNAWNHVRTVSGIMSTGSLIVGLLRAV
ncbi:MAG: DUF1772 domain-containing protein [Tepidisphaeraceae bacterium]